MRQQISLRKALADKCLLGKMLAGDSWQAWRTLLIAAMGEQLTTDERILFTKFTGREREPLQRVATVVRDAVLAIRARAPAGVHQS